MFELHFYPVYHKTSLFKIVDVTQETQDITPFGRKVNLFDYLGVIPTIGHLLP